MSYSTLLIKSTILRVSYNFLIRKTIGIFYHMLSYLGVLLRTDCERIEATTVMKRILHYASRVARMHDDRLPNIVMRDEMVGGKRNRDQPAKRLEHRVTEYCTAFGIDPKCWMRAAQDAPN